MMPDRVFPDASFAFAPNFRERADALEGLVENGQIAFHLVRPLFFERKLLDLVDVLLSIPCELKPNT